MTHHHERPAQPWYVTTSIPYVNAPPHLGHALEGIQADVLARYHRLLGGPVRLQTGTDENSLKNVQAAQQSGVSVQALVDENARHFISLAQGLDLSIDDFIRTSVSPAHRAGVCRLWQACQKAGDIYVRSYRGLYCVGCEQFYHEEELVNGCCPIHEQLPELVEEENYFFRLSRYQERLLTAIESGQLTILPEGRRNEILSFIRHGLQDFSISRSQERARGWGIPVPGDPSQVIYVWFDALINYITALDYDQRGPAFDQFWLSDGTRVHILGKDITRFHAIYWPAMLLSAELPLPTHIYVHGFITVEGRKMSKSLGNVIDPLALTHRFGPDALRYYLLRKIPAAGDGDFSRSEFVAAYNGELADQLGNLLNRVVQMVQRYYLSRIPEPGAWQPEDQTLIQMARELTDQIDHHLADFALHKALAEIWRFIAAANKYVVEQAPWQLARRRGDPLAEQRLATVLNLLLESLALCAYCLQPFLPQTALTMAIRLGISLTEAGYGPAGDYWGQIQPGTSVVEGDVLFPKIEEW